jgi:hypothetical protein
MTENYNLAPDIRTTTIGIRRPKEITVYPVSIASENELLTEFVSLFSSFTDLSGVSDAELINTIKDSIFENIEQIIAHVTEEEVDLNEVTNNQLLALGEIIFEVNFEVLLKNGKGFIEKMKTLFLSMKPSPES